MVLLTAPLHSLNAQGQLAKTLIYEESMGRHYAKAYAVPTNTRTAKEVGIRAMVHFLTKKWAALTTPERASWFLLSLHDNITPFNAYFRYNMQRWAANLPPLIELTDVPAAAYAATIELAATPAAGQVTISIIPATTPTRLTVAGTLSPDATGEYQQAGTYDGIPYYARADNAFFLWHDYATNTWRLTAALGDTDHLLAQFKLNDNAANTTVLDSKGGFNGAASANTSTLSTAGKFNLALVFNGTTQYVSIPKTEALYAIKQQWTKNAGNPVLATAGDAFASVAKIGDTYHSWAAASTTVYHATSTDGVTWTGRAACTGISGGVPYVWFEGSTYHMLCRQISGSYMVIRYASSADGLAWTDGGTVLSQGSSGQWDYNVNIETWGVIKVGATYYMFYDTWGGAAARKVGLATATSPSGPWTKDANNPIFSDGRYCVCPFKHGAYYYLAVGHYTSGATPSTGGEIELYRDASPTFYAASRQFVRTPVHPAYSGNWDDKGLDTPFVITDNINRDSYAASNGQLWMYYAGQQTSDSLWRTGLIQDTHIDSALQTKGLTFSFWMKHSTTGNKDILSWGTTLDQYSWRIMVWNPGGGAGTANLAFGGSTGFIETRNSAATDWNDGLWHHVVCTWAGIDQTTAKIYVDGVLQTTYLNGTFVIGVSDENLSLASHMTNGTRSAYFPGSLDNLLILDRALTQSEVTALYADNESYATATPYWQTAAAAAVKAAYTPAGSASGTPTLADPDIPAPAIAIFRANATIAEPTRTLARAVAAPDGAGDLTWIDTGQVGGKAGPPGGLPSGTYHYMAAPLSLDGRMGAPTADTPATVP